ncbi:MAG: magnesium transporter [Planctomycetota bacterium]
MVTSVPRAAGTEDALAVAHRLAGGSWELADAVYVVSTGDLLEGVVPMHTLLSARAGTRISDLMTRDIPKAGRGTDQERLAHAALRHGLASTPVLEPDGRLAGVVPAGTLMEILYREHAEDLHRLAGINREVMHARDALEEPPTRQVWHRLPWLLVGFAGSVLATFVMSRFEKTLDTRVVIAFFVPAIVYLADAIGTQAEAIAVRGLSLSRIGLRRLLMGEIMSGAIIGAVLGGLAFGLVAMLWKDLRLAAAVSLSLACASTVAASVGLLLPWGLAKAGRDPAYGSGPFATVIQDILSILIYFLLVAAIVR